MRASWFAVVSPDGRWLGAGPTIDAARRAAVPALVAAGREEVVAEVEAESCPVGRIVIDAPSIGELRALVASCCAEDPVVADELMREIREASGS